MLNHLDVSVAEHLSPLSFLRRRGLRHEHLALHFQMIARSGESLRMIAGTCADRLLIPGFTHQLPQSTANLVSMHARHLVLVLQVHLRIEEVTVVFAAGQRSPFDQLRRERHFCTLNSVGRWKEEIAQRLGMVVLRRVMRQCLQTSAMFCQKSPNLSVRGNEEGRRRPIGN